ncbi:hypothetical protein [Micromonospora endophytica]|uniref:DUF4352 domain-containing protein n=1 Tax=Micromonospora endophytica TaxID=515350 RepID=A0A2W2CUV1_9ACTN|nr:hypothetical protein [Micromonospora endophytica]PZF83963.1 hypothetical protein C1I93_29725 [Micromonospora endophytica]RIW45046.1 hypothetical protein D3H59_16230 [Micromonospora endophytica]
MPASRRHHRTLAAIVHCVGFLTALPVLPAAAGPDVPSPGNPQVAAAAATRGTPAERARVAPAAAPHAVTASQPTPATPDPSASPEASAPTPDPAMPAAPPAVPTPTRLAVPPPAPKVSVAVAPENGAEPGYRIEVRNAGIAPVSTTVRQELPRGVSATSISGGGREERPGGAAATAVTWQLRLPPRSTTTLGTTLRTPAAQQPLTAPACAFASNGRQPYDCASATWTNPQAAAAAGTQEPSGWRAQAAALLVGAGAVLLLSVVAFVTWRRNRRPVAAALASDGPGTVYPRPAVPRPPSRRRTPPIWLIVPVAATVLAATIGTAAWAATRRVAAIDTDSQPTSGAWKGTGVSGSLGVPLREDAFEFTVYRMVCDPGQQVRQCQATVGVRNVTPEHQSWHGKLQRAYLPNGNWVTTDESATRRANQGRDVFAEPMAAGSRMVLPLVFTVNGRAAPERLELRSGVFSAGVRVDVP